MIIDIGGGTSEIAVVALGGIVVSRSLRVGGNRFDEAIASYIRRKYNLMIGERTAEEVKIAIGTALPLERELTLDVRGRDLVAGLPRTIPLTSSEVMEAMEKYSMKPDLMVNDTYITNPPVWPGKIIALGNNYRKHIEEMKQEIKERLKKYHILHSTLEFECEKCEECSLIAGVEHPG